MRLPRPYIPLRVRLQVAERQLRETGRPEYIWVADDNTFPSDGHKLHFALGLLFDEQKVELHHRPALCNREVIWDGVRWPDIKYVLTFKSVLATDVRYVPDANDPDHLIWLPKADHDIETRVRGVGAQHSDLGLLRKNKKMAKNRAIGKVTSSSVSGRVWTLKGKLKRKFKWPKRKLQSRSFSRSR